MLTDLKGGECPELQFEKHDGFLPDTKFGYNPLLNEYRNQIDNISAENWKKVRWYINDYDFQVKDPIINRAFYKYWEIINEFEIFEDFCETDIILHMAEAPGGFIQGTNIYLQMETRPSTKGPQQSMDTDGFQLVTNKKAKKRDYIVYSISLNKDLPQYKMYNLPTYNKNVINKYVCITYGKDNTGDINNFENTLLIQKMAKKNFYLITGDGGFDEGIDFNNKEQLHYTLIMSEIRSALFLQKPDGHFILKMFDIFTETSIHLLYLLRLAYKEVWIYKPKTSRPTNSEKYIVCKYFCMDSNTLRGYMQILSHPKKSKAPCFTLFTSVPDNFIESIKKINLEMVERQCVFLKAAIDLCKNNTFFETYDEVVLDLVLHRRNVFHDWETNYNLNAYV